MRGEGTSGEQCWMPCQEEVRKSRSVLPGFGNMVVGGIDTIAVA